MDKSMLSSRCHKNKTVLSQGHMGHRIVWLKNYRKLKNHHSSIHNKSQWLDKREEAQTTESSTIKEGHSYLIMPLTITVVVSMNMEAVPVSSYSSSSSLRKEIRLMLLTYMALIFLPLMIISWIIVCKGSLCLAEAVSAPIFSVASRVDKLLGVPDW